MSRADVLVTGWGLATSEEPGPFPFDASRLRRMDRFARCGFIAGSRALSLARFSRPQRPDPRSGSVVGSAFGCRDSVTEHARLLGAARSAEDLAPAVFAQTVHNTVNGELAIAWQLGGLSETVLAGRASGLEALLLSAGLLSERKADLIVAVGAEGLHPEMRRSWVEERSRFGDRGASVEPLECGAALVLKTGDPTRAGEATARFIGGISFFEPEPREAAERLRASEFSGFFEGRNETVSLTTADLDGFAAGLSLPTPKPVDRLGASGPFAIVTWLDSGGTSPSRVLFVARDPDGPTTAAALERC